MLHNRPPGTARPGAVVGFLAYQHGDVLARTRSPPVVDIPNPLSRRKNVTGESH